MTKSDSIIGNTGRCEDEYILAASVAFADNNSQLPEIIRTRKNGVYGMDSFRSIFDTSHGCRIIEENIRAKPTKIVEQVLSKMIMHSLVG